MQSKGLVLTFFERKTRFAVAVKSSSKCADDIYFSIEGFLKKFGNTVKTITCDRGSEFLSQFTQLIFQKNKIKYYYAHAYSPQERGSNENFNRLLREYFPKKTDFNHISQDELNQAVMSINTRPMKIHNFKSRYNVFKRHLSYGKYQVAL